MKIFMDKGATTAKRVNQQMKILLCILCTILYGKHLSALWTTFHAIKCCVRLPSMQLNVACTSISQHVCKVGCPFCGFLVSKFAVAGLGVLKYFQILGRFLDG